MQKKEVVQRKRKKECLEENKGKGLGGRIKEVWSEETKTG